MWIEGMAQPVAGRKEVLDQEEFSRWRDEASRALEGAGVQAGAGLHNWACFAAEQAAKLTVKAVLHGIGRAPWGHDLVRLGDSMREAVGSGWPESLDPLTRRLSRHYIPARYPDAHPTGSASTHYGPEDSEEAIADAQRVIAVVDSVWRELSQARSHRS